MKVKPLLLCGAIAGPLFIATFLIEDATRANYDPLRHPVSSLALGPFGWVQTLNFVVTGVLTIAYAIGLRLSLRPGKGSLFGPLAVAIWGIGLIGAGLFLTDPVSGYPPGTPAMADPPTTVGALHDLFSVPGFLILPVACLVLARRFFAEHKPWWAIYSILSGVVFLGMFFLSGAGFSQEPGFVDYGGLYQRLCVTTGWLWLTLLAVHLLRAPRPRP